jgi:hypothetical protein
MVKKANDLRDELSPLDKHNKVLSAASEARNRKARIVGSAVLAGAPELSDMSPKEISAWASGLSAYFAGDSLMRTAVSKLTNVEVVDVFWNWLKPQVVGDCIPFEPLFFAYQAFCDRFDVQKPLKRRYFVQTCALFAASDDWVMPCLESTGAPKSVNVYGWMVCHEPYLDSLVSMMRKDGWFSSSDDNKEALERLVRWYPSAITKPDFCATGALYRSEAYDFCMEHVCTPRKWIRDNVLSDVEEPSWEDQSMWRINKWSWAWHDKTCEVIEANYDEFRKAVRKWASKR